MDNNHRLEIDPSDVEAIGIVVQNGPHAEQRPRAVAFVWGGKVRPAPSLPFGRRKNGVPTAA